MPDDFVVSEKQDIGQEKIDRQLSGMVGGIGTGNIRNKGQAAIGDGAMAAESIYYTTYNLRQKGKSWFGTVPGDHLGRLLAGYSPGPSDTELAAALKLRHVVYLSARPGWGRYATAQVALARRHSPDRVVMIHVARGERIVDAVDEGSYSEDHGHVLDAKDAESISFMDLLLIDQHARSRKASVIVIGPLADRGHDLGSYLFPLRRPTAAAVFRSQLTYLLHERGNCVGTCADCGLDCVADYVEKCVSGGELSRHLNETLALEEAARIASVIGTAASDADRDQLVAQILNEQLHAQARLVLRASDAERRADGEHWSGTADYRRAFRLAFGALEGAPMASVYSAAARLVRIHREEQPETAPTPDPIEFELDCLLSYEMQVPDLNSLPVGAPRIARLANPGLVPAMLDVAWNERGLGPRLMRWLGELVTEPQLVVRERAAMMAGLLSFSDFTGVMDGLIAPWARSRSMRPRQAAGLSLLSCAHNPALHPALQGRIKQWMDKTKGNAYTRDTVAWAYAYGLGRYLPYDGLAQLRRIGKDLWQRRSFLVAFGVEQAYTRDRAASLLGELLEWTLAEDNGKRLQVHAARAFVRLSGIETLLGSVRWPELLLRRHRGDVDEQQLADLWLTALCLPSTAWSAWKAFTRWLTLAENDPDVADRFLALLRVLVADGGLRTRLAHHRDHVWAEQRPSSALLTAAAAIIGRV
ncbi:hypothetical protein AFR_30255 [Actinoplanes friuliensis DSM 7358]|uniref:Uncharacterized protein n=1 Tax=Actinoplanes friuliensis DSM 7358 TaxID=1246995 RepID=U5W8P6_9ACTN|nr:hypothetical protein AFR_30255 [Actinoplanes friuliensis DSM 7358]